MTLRRVLEDGILLNDVLHRWRSHGRDRTEEQVASNGVGRGLEQKLRRLVKASDYPK